MSQKSQVLRAGPVRLKLEDGELRYLYVGNKEIVRRIYFAVRDKDWNTALPRFTRVQVSGGADGFQVGLSAECKSPLADYAWHAEIAGTPDGTITWRASGQAGAAFRSPRIGICLLFGAGSLKGQAFETVDAAGRVTPGQFPELVSPDLVAKGFQTLRYTTADGLAVSATMAGSPVDMEDQRNFGDSSFKAFSQIPHAYPEIAPGQLATHTLTLRVSGSRAEWPAAGPARVTVGEAVDGAKMPTVLVAEELPKTPSFWSVNRPQERKKEAKADWVTWSYSPAVHLCDDDLLMENLPAVLDQARTVRSFAPQAKIRVSPVTIDFKGASPRSDPRNRTEFGAAWSAGLIRYLALGGADEAVFAVGPGPATAVQKRLGELAGSQVLATRVDAVGPSPIEALAVEGPKGRLLWLANKTAQPQRAAVGSLSLELAPFEVREIDLGR